MRSEIASTAVKSRQNFERWEAEQDQAERLQQLRERFGIELRRHGLGHLTSARPGDRPLPLVEVMESGWWMVESE